MEISVVLENLQLKILANINVIFTNLVQQTNEFILNVIVQTAENVENCIKKEIENSKSNLQTTNLEHSYDRKDGLRSQNFITYSQTQSLSIANASKYEADNLTNSNYSSNENDTKQYEKQGSNCIEVNPQGYQNAFSFPNHLQKASSLRTFPIFCIFKSALPPKLLFDNKR